MRLVFLTMVAVLGWGTRPAVAQNTASSSSTGNSQERIALSARPTETARRPARMACVPIVGTVFEPNGRPLMGATLLVKGTHEVYVTDSEGRFQLTNPVYEGQVLTVDAAGYTTQDVPLTDCSLPRLVLAKAPTAHIKRSGKRAGQVVRLNNRNTNLK